MVGGITRRGWWSLLLGLALASGVLGSSLNQIRYHDKTDEAYYYKYAQTVASEGIGVVPRLFQEHLDNPEINQFFPAPTRLTTILLGAASVRLFGDHPSSLSKLSVIAFLALLVVMFVGLFRSFGELTACWAVVLLAVSPLSLGLAQRGLADGLACTLFLSCLWGLLWAFQGGAMPARRWGWLSLLFLVTFLSKEVTLFLIPITWVFLLWQRLGRGHPIRLWPVCAVSVVPVALAWGLMAVAAGSIEVVHQSFALFQTGAAQNGYAQLYEQGPATRYIMDFLLVSPGTTLLYLIWLGVLIASRPENDRFWFWSLVPVLFLGMLALFPARNLRLALFVEVPIRLGAVFLLSGWWSRCPKRWAWLGMGISILILGWADLDSFRLLFLEAKIYDPISLLLLQARQILAG